ncbi:MAG TPA: amidohydrolase [Caldisericia bacterium]|nr:amidohydrolase [Caldisericia bacterium]HPF48980.1 amidohydrolase [Caldisericia bacterium]HPI83156.1 amidohydrolase [Caldisericia bacterium]HPQ92383.1 amidohydrolase [Caldisericia bacterium]HRV74519.1 amidohydrolase [Caldisericia bacterium]
MKKLLKGTIIPVSDKFEKEFDGYVLIEDDKILSVSADKPVGETDEYFDFSGMAIMPGLVNTHTHASMTLLRGVADDLPLHRWLHEEIFPREEKLTSEMIYWGAKHAIAEMLRGGTTCFADMYFMMDEVGRAVTECGIKANLSEGMTMYADEDRLKSKMEFPLKWGEKTNGRIKTMLGPHAIYTCPPDFMEKVIEQAHKHNVPIHMHVSETKKEVDDCVKSYGMSPPELLDKLGAFNGHFLAAHCVYLTKNDRELFKQKGVFCALNTSSNFKLASGIASIFEMEREGLNLSIGTDGTASNNDLDMLEEMRWTSFAAKSKGEPTALPATRALRMATADGARALGFDDIGSIEPGKKADIVVVDFSAAHMQPCFSKISHLVNCAHTSDVLHVLIDGEFVVKNRKIQTFDEKETSDMVVKFAQELA